MDAAAIARHIITTLDGVDTVEAGGDTFFFVGDAPADQRMPFATLVSGDAHDSASDLARPEVFRLNIGVGRETYASMFGAPPSGPVTADPIDTGHDYTTLDELMPHPIYASLAWVCVLNPSDATFERVRALLIEAHALASARRSRREARA